MCCWDGRGTPQDYVEAYKWLNLAAASGQLPSAGENRNGLAKLMTPIQIAEAQRRAAAFTPGKGSKETKEDAKPDTTTVKASCTGFFVTTNGFVLTACHVVADASNVMVGTSGKLIPAKIIKVDAANDVAVLKVDGSFPALPIEQSRKVGLGDAVFTIGFPNEALQGFKTKLTKGDISGLAGIQDDPRHFQISVPIQPGNSGGPLVNMDGNVIGILVSRLSDAAALETTGMLPQNVNYALKSGYVTVLMESIPTLAVTNASGNHARPFDQVVKEVEAATVMLLVY
jgi:S1-C subfamily serine protease